MVAAGTALLCGLPALIGLLPVAATATPAATLLARIRSSAAVGYSGLVESQGNLGLPSLPRLGSLDDLLSGTTRSRVWYAGPNRYRVDRLTAIGEDATYRDPAGSWSWSSGQNQARRLTGQSALRLPTPEDLVPPSLARRLAAPAAPTQVASLPARRVAGRGAAGVRIMPPGTTTIGRIDIWADARSGLPLSIQIVGRGADAPSVTSRFLDVRLSAPEPSLLAFSPPPDAEIEDDVAPDIVSAIDRFSPYALPAHLAGLVRRPRVSGLGGGAATYGDGYALLAVLPLRDRLASSLLAQLSGPAGRSVTVPRGRAAALVTPLVDMVVQVGPYQSFLLAGTLPPPRLARAASELTSRPLPLRIQR